MYIKVLGFRIPLTKEKPTNPIMFFAMVVLVLSITLACFYMVTKSEGYAVAYEYVLCSEGYSLEDDPFVLLINYSSKTVRTEDTMDAIANFTFLVDWVPCMVTCENHGDGWRVSKISPQ